MARDPRDTHYLIRFNLTGEFRMMNVPLTEDNRSFAPTNVLISAATCFTSTGSILTHPWD